MTKKRVAVAMSGGVDSSFAAVLLLKEGYDVIGITHQTWPSEKEAFGGCCGLDAIDSARAVAGKLDIPYYVLDFRDEFTNKVISRFCTEYSQGRTPNPCVLCNKYIRFQTMLNKVKQMDIDYLATGHYARIRRSADGYHLLKAIDKTKDQAYFLYSVTQHELPYLLFPLGDYLKSEVRKMAADIGLPVASRPESQDICFITEDYRTYIRQCVELRPGDIINTDGKIVGRHEGLALYTIGQRHGLGIPSNEPLYVIKLDARQNQVIIGKKSDLAGSRLLATQLNWISGRRPDGAIDVTVKIRYKAPESTATLLIDGDVAKVELKQPQTAITPGQSAVFYHDDEVLGGGIIESSE